MPENSVDQSFKVFKLIANYGQPFPADHVSLINAGTEPLKSYTEASIWIRKEGEPQTDYIILEVFRKS